MSPLKIGGGRAATLDGSGSGGSEAGSAPWFPPRSCTRGSKGRGPDAGGGVR